MGPHPSLARMRQRTSATIPFPLVTAAMPHLRVPSVLRLLAALAAATLAFAACSTLRLAVAFPLIEDVAAATARYDDVDLVTHAAPTYLLLLEGLLESSPDNGRLLVAASEAYTAYGALVETEDLERARRLYARGRDHALRALSQKKGVAPLLTAPYEHFVTISDKLDDDDLRVVFWTASSWGAWISASTESMAALADLPRVIHLMEWVLKRDEAYNFASPHLFLGMYHTAVPPLLGGDPEASRTHFERALELTEGKALMVHVQMARFYARQVFDRTLYERLLRQVLDAPLDAVPELTLQNRAAQHRAARLLEEVDEYF